MSDFDDAVQNSSAEIHAASQGVAEGYEAGHDALDPNHHSYGETSAGEYSGSAGVYHDVGYAVGFGHGSVEEWSQQHPTPEQHGNWDVQPVQPGEPAEYPYGGDVPNGNWGVKPVQPGEPVEYPYGGDVPNGNWGVEPVQPGEPVEYPYGGDVPNGNWGVEPVQPGEPTDYPSGGDVPNDPSNWGFEPI